MPVPPRPLSTRAADSSSPLEATLAGPDRLLRVEGIHCADDLPLATEERLISLAAVPEAEEVDFGAVSPGTWLLRHVPWTEAETRIAAVPACRAVAARLNVALGSACLFIERRTWSRQVAAMLTGEFADGVQPWPCFAREGKVWS